MKSKRIMLVLVLVLLLSLVIATAAMAAPEVLVESDAPGIMTRFGLVGD